MKSNLLFVLGICLLMAASLPFLLRSRPPAIAWHTNISEALDKAEIEGKPILAFLYTDWCGYCKQMDNITFKDSAVVDTLSNAFVPVRLNAEESPAGIRLSSEFRVSGFPTILILDSKQQEIDRLQGFMPPQRFIQSLERLTTLSSIATHFLTWNSLRVFD